GSGDGFIPKHPSDLKGKPPLNASDGVLTFHGKGTQEMAEIKSTPEKLQIVTSLPAGYDASWTKSLARVEQPVIEGRRLNGGVSLASVTASQTGNPKTQAAIRYDYKTRNFLAFSSVAGD